MRGKHGSSIAKTTVHIYYNLTLSSLDIVQLNKEQCPSGCCHQREQEEEIHLRHQPFSCFQLNNCKDIRHGRILLILWNKVPHNNLLLDLKRDYSE